MAMENTPRAHILGELCVEIGEIFYSPGPFQTVTIK
jgi:hypothetical protein